MERRLKADPAGGGDPDTDPVTDIDEAADTGPDTGPDTAQKTNSGLDPFHAAQTAAPAADGGETSAPATTDPDKSRIDPRFDSPDLQRLRALLLHDDRTTIADLRDRLGLLSDRLGDDAALGLALESVLVETLQRMQASQAPGLRKALAPVVVKTIRSEVRNSREELVNALYPLTGKMVAAAMRDAVRKLTDNINESVERASNPALVWARIRARLGGKPVAQELLERKSAARINRAILIDRVSGMVECSYSVDDRIDEDLIGGLISALSTFATQTYAHRNSELRTIELEGHRLLLRHSPLFLLALEVDGEPTAGQVEAVDALFLDLMTEQDADPDQIDEARLERFVEDVEAWRPETKRPLFKPVLIAALVALAGWFGFQYWQAWQFDTQVDRVRALVASQAELNAFGVQVSGDQDTNAISVRGLVPVGFATNAFRAQAAGLVREDTALAVALQPIEIEGGLSERLAGGEAALARVDKMQGALAQQADALAEQADAMAGQVDTLAAQVGTLGAQTQALVARDTAITNRLTAVESRAVALADRAVVLDERTGALDGQTAALGDRMSTLESRQTDVATSLTERLKGGLAELETSTTDRLSALRASTEQANGAFERKIGALQSAMEEKLAVLTGSLDGVASRTAANADAVDTLEAGARRDAAASRLAMAGLSERLKENAQEAARNQERLRAAVTNGQSARETARRTAEQARLSAFIERSRLRFDRGTQYLDPYTSQLALTVIADAMVALGKPLEIRGHADRLGTAAQNRINAKARAETVKRDLVALGVPERLLKVRSMGASQATGTAGPGSIDRRVTFGLEKP